MLWARVLADLIVTFHACYVAFVVFGLVLILVGIALRWSWVRNVTFRVVHLAMIVIPVGETLAGAPCPLTVWEKQLRILAGQATYPGEFLGYWAHRLIFFNAPPWVFTLVYMLFGLTVLLTFLLAPPHWPHRAMRSTASAPSSSPGLR
jgi:hypothetical protein